MANLVLYGSQDDDVSIVGTWQAYEFNLFTGDDCENLLYQILGPTFSTGDLPEWDDGDDEDCDDEEYTGYEYTQMWWTFDENNNLVQYNYEESDQRIDEMEDDDCDNIYTYCQYYEEETIEKEFGIGEYSINNNSVTLEIQTYLEFKNGWDANGWDYD